MSRVRVLTPGGRSAAATAARGQRKIDAALGGQLGTRGADDSGAADEENSHAAVVADFSETSSFRADMPVVKAFLRRAEEILDIAMAGDRDAGDLAILIDRQGGMRMLDPKGWSIARLMRGVRRRCRVLRGAARRDRPGGGMGRRRTLPDSAQSRPAAARPYFRGFDFGRNVDARTTSLGSRSTVFVRDDVSLSSSASAKRAVRSPIAVLC